ncbi:MAG: DUF6512 family protein [Blautia sp.]|jgi:hypothetical protein
MKKEKLTAATWCCILSTLLIGCLWHFIYEWSGRSSLIGLAAPVNESVWEHTKLLVFPMLLTVTAEHFFLRKKYHSLITAGIFALIPGIVVMPLLFYAYYFFTKRSYLWADIAIFLVSVLTAFATQYLLVRHHTFTVKEARISRTLLFLIIIIYILLTLYPPSLGLFTPL